jgi:hypothetical protein
MAAMRKRYQLFTAGPEPINTAVADPEPAGADTKKLLDLLTEEELKGSSRQTDAETKRRKKACTKDKRRKRKRRASFALSRRPSRRSTSAIKLRDLDRLKLLIEKELEEETEEVSIEVKVKVMGWD